MYAYWIVVITFSMLTLIMVYTYQFDRFEELYTDFLSIDTDL